MLYQDLMLAVSYSAMGLGLSVGAAPIALLLVYLYRSK
jgi:hypothetical protein